MSKKLTESSVPRIDVGPKLRKLRHEAKWSQQYLAIQADVKQATICRIEIGKELNPSINLVNRLALAFGMTLGEFVDEKQTDKEEI